MHIYIYIILYNIHYIDIVSTWQSFSDLLPSSNPAQASLPTHMGLDLHIILGAAGHVTLCKVENHGKSPSLTS